MWYWEGLLVCLQQTWRPGQVWVLVCQVLAGFDTSGCGGEDLHPGEGLFLHYGLSGMRGHWGWVGATNNTVHNIQFGQNGLGMTFMLNYFGNHFFEKINEQIIIFYFRKFSIAHRYLINNSYFYSGGGGSLLGHQGNFPYSPLMGGLPHTSSRPPAPGSFNPFPAQLLYWPYPSPPISPNNYFLPPHGHMSSPSSLLTPTSSISSLSNGVTSPLPSGGPQGQGSPQLPQGPPPNTLVGIV